MSNRWSTASGRVVSVRLPDSVYGVLEERAVARGMSVNQYVKQVLVSGADRYRNGK